MKYSLKVDRELQEELNKTLKRNCLIMVIIGAIGLVAYIAISMFIEHFLLEIFLWIFAGLLGVGVCLLIVINKTNKKAADNNFIGEYELFEEYLIVNTFKNDEQISTIKLYYKDVIKIKETENYIFLYPNKQIAYPIAKKKLLPEELSMVKLWINAARLKK